MTHMHWSEWAVVIGFVVFLCGSAYSTRRHMQSVADFLAAGRCAGKYLLAMGDGMAGLGAISIVGAFQMFYEGGFTPFWWNSLLYPIGLLTAVTGWIIYRFRETRALTLAQFFEMRYSRRVRVFAGILVFVSGIINFGIFPSVGSRFFVYFTGIPLEFHVLGLAVSSYALVMALLVGISLAFALFGGQIAVIVTDFAQSVFCNVVFVLVMAFLMWKIDWSDVVAAMSHAPENQSLTNPFQIGGLENYNFWYFATGLVGAFYTAYAWQGQQGYNTSARNPHEAKMSKILGFLRGMVAVTPVLIITVYLYAYMHAPAFSDGAAAVNEALGRIENEQVQKQMTLAVGMNHLLPMGLAGLFLSVILAAFISTHDTYLHSWGAILLQDVIMPFRKKPFTPEQHIRYLRWSITGVAVFIYLFSLYYVQGPDVLMFFALSGSLFLGAAGSLIIGGLYWKRGTTAGAWASLVASVVMSLASFVLVFGWSNMAPVLQARMPGLWHRLAFLGPRLKMDTFFLTPQELFLITMAVCAAIYVLVSLLTPTVPFNLDRMLHRGRYRIKDDQTPEDRSAVPHWKKVLGLERDLPIGDKAIFAISYGSVFLMFGGALFGTAYHLIFGIPDGFWLPFWHGYLWLLFAVSAFIALWFIVGGMFDLRAMFRLLAVAKRDFTDDGTVVDGQNRSDVLGDGPLPNGIEVEPSISGTER